MNPTRSDHSSLRPVVAFFGLAYAIAWGLWLLLSWAAQHSAVETDAFVRMVEAQDFGTVQPVMPGWPLYLLTRVVPDSRRSR